MRHDASPHRRRRKRPMTTNRGFTIGLALSAATLLALACHSTKISEVWMPKGETPRTYQRLMIVALAPTPGGRARYENDFVDKLATVHVLAVASINVVPDVQAIDRKVVESWLTEYRLDGVIVTRVTDVKRETEYIPPSYTLGGWYGAWGVPTSPGRTVENTTIALETDLFDAASEKLVYSAITKTFNPSSREKAVHDVIDALFADMSKRGLLPKASGS
jgi:hypothetical protein